VRGCDHGKYASPRCRKRARFAIQHKVYFGKNIGPQGDSAVYALRVTFRCAGHRAVPEQTGILPMSEYETATARAAGRKGA
jgi:hypothetical protein